MSPEELGRAWRQAQWAAAGRTGLAAEEERDMKEYIRREDALNLDFRIPVQPFESRLKTAERAVQAYADKIGELPAADVRPVVRGEWIHDGSRFPDGVDWWHCSNCLAPETGVYATRPFCSRCGADMRDKSYADTSD